MNKLGRTGHDAITGFVGIITGRVEYIIGCRRLQLTPSVGDYGAAAEPKWFDEARVVVEDVPPVELPPAETGPGFDAPAPIR